MNSTLNLILESEGRGKSGSKIVTAASEQTAQNFFDSGPSTRRANRARKALGHLTG